MIDELRKLTAAYEEKEKARIKEHFESLKPVIQEKLRAVAAKGETEISFDVFNDQRGGMVGEYSTTNLIRDYLSNELKLVETGSKRWSWR